MVHVSDPIASFMTALRKTCELYQRLTDGETQLAIERFRDKSHYWLCVRTVK